MADVLADVATERARQISLGYDAKHDDEHGYRHLIDQAQRRVAGRLHTRDDLIEATALLVAAVEWMDRVADPLPPMDTAQPFATLTNTQEVADVCSICRIARTPEHGEYSPLQVMVGQPIGWYSGDDGDMCGACMAALQNGQNGGAFRYRYQGPPSAQRPFPDLKRPQRL